MTVTREKLRGIIRRSKELGSYILIQKDIFRISSKNTIKLELDFMYLFDSPKQRLAGYLTEYILHYKQNTEIEVEFESPPKKGKNRWAYNLKFVEEEKLKKIVENGENAINKWINRFINNNEVS